MSLEYWWWREWHDDKRRMWAQRMSETSPHEARAGHARDKQGSWCSDEMVGPRVSTLWVTSDQRTSELADGGPVIRSPELR